MYHYFLSGVKVLSKVYLREMLSESEFIISKHVVFSAHLGEKVVC